MRTLLAGATCALATLSFAPAASAAALEFSPCTGTPDFECAEFDVPLDPGGQQPGTLTLSARRLVETREAPQVLIALAGGPGQSSTRFIEDFADLLAEGLENRQLVVFDQRGTGDSGPLRCAALDNAAPSRSAADLKTAVGRCGKQLGPSRRHYTTTEVVEDLEALRRGLGVERVAIFGVSSGSYVAQRYARRYPDRVDRLVLDSAVAQDQSGPFDASSYTAVARMLRQLCRERACRGISHNPVADLRRLRGRLSRGRLRARVYDRRGRGSVRSLAGEAELFDLLVSSDLAPALRDGLPAAIHSAATGDEAPLVRLLAVDDGSSDAREFDEETESAEEFSNALFFASTCQEKPLPWRSAATPIAERPAEREAALDALGTSAFAPFGRAAAESTQVGTAFCERWPETTIAPVPAPGAIQAPALILSGLMDMRTPPHEALRTAALIPDASLVRVPGGGHSLVSTRLGCVQTALTRFFADRAVGNPCAGLPPRAVTPRLAPLAPTRLREVNRGGVRGSGARVVAAALATAQDAARIVAARGLLDSAFAFGGLRGGVACARPGELDTAGRRPVILTFERDAYVAGLAFSGRAVLAGGRIASLRLTSSAPGPRAGLQLRGQRVHGTVGQHRVRAQVSPARLTVSRQSVATSLAGARRRCG